MFPIRHSESILKNPLHQRRGVASVLAMMFMVLFGSLAAAMAVVAQGNLRTADSSLKLSRAMSAAETGMVFAQRRLAEQAAQFVVEKGVIDADFAEDLWKGTYDVSADGAVTLLDPTDGPGIVHALRDVHAAETHFVTAGAEPTIDGYSALRVPAITLKNEANPEETAANSAYFLLTYELVDDSPYVRVTSEGVDGTIHRTLEMDFRIDKKIEFAILSPNRIMIGKNVRIEGPLGSRYGLVAGELDTANGDPLVMRSDFYYLNDTLNTNLDLLYSKIVDHDVDGDGRLRPGHPDEMQGLTGQPELADRDGDEYVDDFDLFLGQFDANGDAKVVFSGGTIEYGSGADDDMQMLRLIDKANPDRDGDGDLATASDIALGYNDGVIDINDRYCKVDGRLGFSVTQPAWETPNGAHYQTVVQGPIRSDIDVPPTMFEVTEEDMREITTAMFNESQSWFEDQATEDFTDQLSGGTTIEPSNNTWEAVPLGSAGPNDYYKRRIFKDYQFNNVRIPKGTNALFENCTFVGVTFVETQEECTDYNWNSTGVVQQNILTDVNGVTTITYPLAFPSAVSTIPSSGATVTDTKTESNNLRFHNCTFLGSLSGDKPAEYMHWRNKIQMTGSTRFYIDPQDADLAADDHPDADDWQSTLAGMDDDDLAELQKSSILLPGWSVDVGNFNNEQAADPEDTPKIKLKGTIIAGILDVRGTADVHGTLLMTFRPTAPSATLPDAAAGPLAWGGLVDGFNTTIGYFGPLDGDGEGTDPTDADFEGFGEITIRYDPNAKLPDGIPWPIRIDAAPETYFE